MVKMWTNQPSSRSSRLTLWVGLAGVGIGVAVGFGAGVNPFYVGVALGALSAVVYFFTKFDQAVMGLLILRSSLDIFTTSLMPGAFKQIPAAFGIGLEALVLLYVIVLLLTEKSVRTDGFWWFFAGWVALQGLWLILLVLGGLGFGASFLPNSLREWIRLSSFPMVYLLVMQLKGKLDPEKIISLLFFSLISPLAIALIQIFLPSVIPPLVAGDSLSEGVRINGTFGHPNSFAVYLLLFIGLTCWKLTYSTRRLPWFLLLGLLVFVFSTTRTMIALVMLCVFVIVMIAPKLSITNLIGGILLFAIVIGLFTSTDFGQQRLASIANTPLLNPDIDASRAILLSQTDYNSFNWRIAQWTTLLQAWRQYPILGYGLGLSIFLVPNSLLPHNDYVRALVEGGVVGLVTLLVFFVAQIVRLVQVLRHTPRNNTQYQLCLIVLAVFLSTPIGMLSENIWVCTAFYFYYWTVFAVCGWNWDAPTPKPIVS